jgi:hypothetical protein
MGSPRKRSLRRSSGRSVSAWARPALSLVLAPAMLDTIVAEFTEA